MDNDFVPIAIEDPAIYEFNVGHEYLLAVKFGEHYEWAKLRFEAFSRASQQYYHSFIESVPCCKDAHDDSSVDEFFDSLISRRFSLGEWLKAPRLRHPAATGQEACRDRSQQAAAVLKPYTVQKAREELEAFANSWDEDQATKGPSKVTKRKRKKGETKAPAKGQAAARLKRARTIHRNVQQICLSNAGDSAQLRDLRADAEDAKSLEYFVSMVEQGIEKLRNSPDHEPRQQYLPFETLIQYRRSASRGSGEGLRQAFDHLAARLRLDSKSKSNEFEKEIWTQTLLSENTRLIERAENPLYSANGPSSDFEVKQKEKRSRILNKIVNSLQEELGMRAWRVISALRETHPSLRDFYRIPEDRIDSFAKSAATRVKHCNFGTIPDSVPSIHIPAVLSWLLDKRFDTICQYLHLENFANKDPGIAAKLDDLASQYEELENDETVRASLETSGSRLMALSFSKFKGSHLNEVRREACQSIQLAGSDPLPAQSTSNDDWANETPTRPNIENGHQQLAEASTSSSPDSRQSIQPNLRAEVTYPHRSSSPSPHQSQQYDDLSSHRSTSPTKGWEPLHQQHYRLLLNMGPQLQLATERRVSDTAKSIAFAMNGNIDGLKSLFERGQASPQDVSASRGFTLMRWALYSGMHQYKTVQFLISQGAQVDEDSYEHVFDFAFRGKCSCTELSELSCVRNGRDSDWIEGQNFPLIHRIILRLPHAHDKSLAAELRENPSAVHVKDALGRTALDWATARAQLDDMKLLISHGSDPNTMDIQGRSTVLHAVDSHNDEAVRIILEAGANPNPTVPEGQFRSSPLTSASFGGLAGTIKLLLQFKAEIHACNPEGRTALHWVAMTQNVECAVILLESGANMHCQSNEGRTPLVTAIIYNTHAVLELFVDRYTTADLIEKPRLLPIIAEHADVKTMSILASSLQLKVDLGGDSFAASREILRQRRDYSQELSDGFEKLLM